MISVAYREDCQNGEDKKKLLSLFPIVEPKDYISFANTLMYEEEIEKICYFVNRGKPFDSKRWSDAMINKYKLMTTVRKRGRQIKDT